MQPGITVIVPTVGRPVLRQCLQSIADGTSWPERMVVIDQSDNADVPSWVHGLQERGMAVTHVHRPRRGVAAARNRGIELVTTRWLAINDDDQVVAPEWLSQMVEGLEAYPDSIITGRVDAAAEGVPSTISSPLPAVHQVPLRDRDPLFAGNMGAALAVQVRVGPFDESAHLNGAEDNDWGHRALRARIPIVYLPSVAVTHLDWRDDRQLAETHRRYARAQGAFYGKHVRRGDVHLARRAVRDLLRGPWLVLRATVTRNAHLRMLGRAEVLGILPGLVAGLRHPAR